MYITAQACNVHVFFFLALKSIVPNGDVQACTGKDILVTRSGSKNKKPAFDKNLLSGMLDGAKIKILCCKNCF